MSISTFRPLALSSLLIAALAMGACATTGGSSAGGPGTAGGAGKGAVDPTGDKIKAAIAGTHRDEKDRARDQYRHPLETLSFFGLREDMTVVELANSAGWYTDILAPVLRDKGLLRITGADPAGGPADKYPWSIANKYAAKVTTHPEIYGKVENHYWQVPEKVDLGPDGSADMVVTFRNLHNWIENKADGVVIDACFKVLKSGGVLGVEDHRAKPGSDPKETAERGYIDEDAVIKLIESHGFKLVEKSEVNANPKDTKDHPKGVWNLPPSLQDGDKDKEKYLAIGESDRFTLKFVKP